MDYNDKTKTDDELLMQFFGENRPDIADDGFSERVMRQLPRRAQRLERAWTTVCFAAAMALFLVFDGVAELRTLASNLMGDAAGYLSSVDLGGLQPLTLLASAVLLGMVSLYNLLSTQR